MITRFKKPISYLLVTMLVFPTCLMSWFTKASTVQAALLPEVFVTSQITRDTKPDISGTYVSASRPDSIKVRLNGIEYSSPSSVHVLDNLTWHLDGLKIITPLAEDVYDISVTMRDNDVEVTDKTSNELTIDRTDPSVLDVSSDNEDGAYSKDNILYISVKFTEIVKVSGTPFIYLNLGTIRKAYYRSGSGTDTLVFSYVIESTDSTSDLDYPDNNSLRSYWPADIEDLAGNNAVLALAEPSTEHSLGFNKNIIVDKTAPEVKILTPIENEKVSGGTKYAIKWEVKDLESGIKDNSILIEYKRAHDDWVEIVKNAPNIGSYEWLVPVEITQKNDAMIRVTAQNKAGLTTREESKEFSIFDYTKPVITLNGDNPMTILKGSTFTDPGSTVTDNYPGTYSATVTAGAVDSNTIGTYYLTYNVKDAANWSADPVVRTVIVAQVNPTFTVSLTGGKGYVVKFKGVGSGATSYLVVVNGVGNSVSAYNSGDDLDHEYSYTGSVLEYGKSYSVYVQANGSWGSVKSAEQTINIAVPATSQTTSSTVRTAVATSTREITGSSASAADEAPTVTPPSQNSSDTPSDDNGKIKGEDESDQTEEEDKVNWTPWIVLFILIILAGAATGGYFYWFAGEEESQDKGKKQTATVEKEENKGTIEPKTTSSSGKSSKKSRRW